MPEPNASVPFFRSLLEYGSWANELIMNRAREASAPDYMARVDGLSFGSLHATLIHIMTSEIVWLARWMGDTPPQWVALVRQSEEIARTEIPSLEALTTLWQANSDRLKEYTRTLTDDGINTRIAYRDLSGNEAEQPMSELIAHVVNHGTQYRSEAAVRLTQLGLSPGDLDLVTFHRRFSS